MFLLSKYGQIMKIHVCFSHDTMVKNTSRIGDISTIFAEIIKYLIDADFYCGERI